MKFVITGASGFIGSRLTYYLADKGFEVKALARNREKALPFESKGIPTAIADITNKSTLYEAFAGADVVLHLAALFNRPEATWEDYHSVNVEGTLNVLQVAQEVNVDRVVHCSTGGVVASNPNPPFSEESPYAVPKSDKYEMTKCEGEKLAREFGRKNNYPIVIIRPTQPYGPGDVSKAKFYKLVKKGIIVNPGKTKKHPVYIDDLCRAFEIAAVNPNAIGEVFLIGGKDIVFLRDLVRTVAAELQVAAPRIVLPAIPMVWLCSITEVLCNCLKIKPVLYRRSMDFFTKSVEFQVTKAKEMLGFESQTDIKTGVHQTAEWYRAENYI
jgi:farnesol dehydrogenase